jgi:hypothetical protein
MLSLSFSWVRALSKGLGNTSPATREGLPTLAGVRTVAWIAAALLLAALMYLAQSSNAALIARNLRVKQDRTAELQRQDAQLRYDIAQAKAPPTMQRRALALGLGPAKHVVYSTLPELNIDLAEVMPAFAPRAAASVIQDSTTVMPSLLDQLLALFGLGGASNRAQAESQ